MNVKRIIIGALTMMYLLSLSGESNAQSQFYNPYMQLKDEIIISPITGHITQSWWGSPYWEYHKLLIPVLQDRAITDFRFKAVIEPVDEVVSVLDGLEFSGSSLPDIGEINVWENHGYIGPDNGNDIINGSSLFKIKVMNGNLHLVPDSLGAITGSPPSGFDPFDPPSFFPYGFISSGCGSSSCGSSQCFDCTHNYPFGESSPPGSYQITDGTNLLRDDFIIGVPRGFLTLCLYDCRRDHIDHYYLKFDINTATDPKSMGATLYRFGQGPSFDNQAINVGELENNEFDHSGGTLAGITQAVPKEYIANPDFLNRLNEVKNGLNDDDQDGIVMVPVYLYVSNNQSFEGGIKIYDVHLDVDIHGLLDEWLDDRWSGEPPDTLIQAINTAGLGITDVEAMLVGGRAEYPDAPQPRGQITTDLPIDAEHVDHSTEYLMYVPTSYDKTARTPLLIVGHGGNSCMRRETPSTHSTKHSEEAAMDDMTPWISYAEQDGYLIVAPLTDRGWAHIGNSILLSTLSKVKRDYNIDPDRIYLAGHSMGGHLTNRSGIYMGDRLAAISPMSGAHDYVASGLVENLFNIPGFATWGELEPYDIDDHNRKIRDWMKDHGFPWKNWEMQGGGHAIFPGFLDDIWNLFAGNRRNPYRQTVFARADPSETPGGLSIPNLQFDKVYYDPQLPCWETIHTWNAQRPIPASTFHWLRLSPPADNSIVQRVWAVNKGDNLFEITSENARKLRLYLHPDMVDFNSPVRVKVNGDILFNDLVETDMATMLNLVREFDDRGRIFHAAIDVDVNTDLTPPGPNYFDLNSDGCVDRTDLSILLGAIRNPGPDNPIQDFNRDGLINIADARYLVTHFTNPRGAACP